MVVEFTYAVSAYHQRCEFESSLCRGVLDTIYVIKLVSVLRQVGGFLRVLRFSPPIKLTVIISLKVTLNTMSLPSLYYCG